MSIQPVQRTLSLMNQENQSDERAGEGSSSKSSLGNRALIASIDPFAFYLFSPLSLFLTSLFNMPELLPKEGISHTFAFLRERNVYWESVSQVSQVLIEERELGIEMMKNSPPFNELTERFKAECGASCLAAFYSAIEARGAETLTLWDPKNPPTLEGLAQLLQRVRMLPKAFLSCFRVEFQRKMESESDWELMSRGAQLDFSDLVNKGLELREGRCTREMQRLSTLLNHVMTSVASLFHGALSRSFYARYPMLAQIVGEDLNSLSKIAAVKYELEEAMHIYKQLIHILPQVENLDLFFDYVSECKELDYIKLESDLVRELNHFAKELNERGSLESGRERVQKDECVGPLIRTIDQYRGPLQALKERADFYEELFFNPLQKAYLYLSEWESDVRSLQRGHRDEKKESPAYEKEEECWNQLAEQLKASLKN